MSLPSRLRGRLDLPAIVAPMFLISGPDLVVEACRAGLIGTFPALNQRTTQGYSEWLDEITRRLNDGVATPMFGVNLIVHKSNPRLEADLKVTVSHKVPLVITSLGAVPDLVKEIHAYGGLVFHDVINTRHAEKAIEAGVDGIVAVAAGAGGHAGTINPFALVTEIRSIFDGTIALAGSLSTGAHIAAARLLGADLAYIGTRFIATRESLAPDAYKQMLVDAKAIDIIYTAAISGVNANFLRPSILKRGLDPDNLISAGHLDIQKEGVAWKDVWSAGHGVGSIHDIPATADLCLRLKEEYARACHALAS